jgi:hypothetical protein
MSFILDALRKVDRENRQSDEVVPPVAAIAKLRKERVHRRRQFAAMTAIAVTSAAATALLLRRPVPEPAPSHPPAPQAAVIEAVVETRTEGIPVEETGNLIAEVRSEPADLRRLRNSGGLQIAPAMAPVEASRTEPPRLVLQGTSVLDGRPVAVVSDRRVFEGDIIDGAVVIRIQERSVELEFEGRRFTLTL